MPNPLHFCLVGGDARQRFLSELLRRDGHTVTEAALANGCVDLSPLASARCVVLPTPILNRSGELNAPFCTLAIPMSTVLDSLSPAQLIFGGKVTTSLREEAAQRGLTIHDHLLREEAAIANAIPTAEGAVQLAMEHLSITIQKSRVLVAGFGRVGQCTARKFQALGAQVWVCARSPAQLSLADSMDCIPLPLSTLGDDSVDFDLVVNTVPARIFTREQLAQLGFPLLLELASPPGGFDTATAQDLGLLYVNAPGLPGKVAPLTAAQIIQKTIYRMLEELEH